MMNHFTRSHIHLFFIALILFVITLGATSVNARSAFQITETPTPLVNADNQANWVIIDLPEGATQLEIGKEAYRLVCAACHAYDGSGLTDEWRATWNEKDQNCWQSKCHGDNHPVDGFFLPDSPPVVGSFVPSFFPTAQDMFVYIKRTMPWQNPGRLPDDIAWAVTAHVISLNGYDSIPELNAENAVSFRLQPETTSTRESTAAPIIIVKPTETSAPMIINTNNKELKSGKSYTFIWISGAALAILGIVFVLRKSRTL